MRNPISWSGSGRATSSAAGRRLRRRIPNFLDLRAQAQQLRVAGGDQQRRLHAGRPNGEAEIVLGLQVTATFLPALKITPVLGRNFLDEEDRPGGNTRVVLISDGFWRRAFGADPNVIGRTISLELAALHHHRRAAGVVPMGHQHRHAGAARTGSGAQSRRPSALGDRPRQGRRVDRSGAHRARNHRRAARTAISRIEQGLGRASSTASTTGWSPRRRGSRCWCCSARSRWCC